MRKKLHCSTITGPQIAYSPRTIDHLQGLNLPIP